MEQPGIDAAPRGGERLVHVHRVEGDGAGAGVDHRLDGVALVGDPVDVVGFREAAGLHVRIRDPHQIIGLRVGHDVGVRVDGQERRDALDPLVDGPVDQDRALAVGDVAQEEVEAPELGDGGGQLVDRVVDREAGHAGAGVHVGVRRRRVIELQLVGVDHHRLLGLLTAVDLRVAAGAVEVQCRGGAGVDLLERLLAVQDVGLALRPDLVDGDRRDPVAVGVDKGVVDEVGVGDIGIGDLAGPDHHLGLLPAGVGVAVDGDVVEGLVAAGAIDLIEDGRKLGGILDADVGERPGVGGEIPRQSRADHRLEGLVHDGSLPAGGLQTPGVAARGQVVVDRLGLSLLGVGVDGCGRVHRLRNDGERPRHDQPAAEHAAHPGDRPPGGAAPAGPDQQRADRHREGERDPLEGTQHGDEHVQIGGVGTDERVLRVRLGGQVVDAEVRPQPGHDEDADQRHPGVPGADPERVVHAHPLGRVELDVQLIGGVDDHQGDADHRDRAEEADDRTPPEQRREGVDHREGEDEEAVVHVKDGIGGAEGVAVDEEEDVLPGAGEVGAPADAGQDGDGDPGPEGDPAGQRVDAAHGARPEGHAGSDQAAGDDQADQEEDDVGDQRGPEDVGVPEAGEIEVVDPELRQGEGHDHQHDDHGDDDQRDLPEPGVARTPDHARPAPPEQQLRVEVEGAHRSADGTRLDPGGRAATCPPRSNRSGAGPTGGWGSGRS